MPDLTHLEGGNEGVAASLQDNIKSKMTSFMTVSNLIILSVSIILLIIGYFVYKKMKSSPQSKYNVNNEFEGEDNNNNQENEAEIMLFTVDWCPHCKTAKPEWDKIKAEYDGKEIKGHTMVFTEVNCTEETPETAQLMNTYKIEGYPTIKLLKDGQVIEYDAKPQYDTLKEFLNNVL